MGFLDSLFDPGKEDREAAARLAQQAVITGGNFSGPGGIGGSFDFSGGQGGMNLGLGSFQGALDQLQGLSGSLLSQAQGGLPSELQQLGQGAIDRLGNIDVNRLQNQSDFNQLGQLFGSAAATAGRDVFDMGSEVSSRLRQLSERRNQRLVNKTFDRLKRSGKLGTTAGAGIAGELDMNLRDQALQQDLAGLQFGQSELQRAFGNVLGASRQREAIGGRQFGEEFGLEQLGGNRALQQFGVGQEMFQNLLRNQLQGTQLGLAAQQGAQSTAQLPLAFMQALGGMQGQAANSALGASDAMLNVASQAQSPFLQALIGAGTFASGGGLGPLMGGLSSLGGMFGGSGVNSLIKSNPFGGVKNA